MNSNTVITISRQYGCGGRELAEILVKKLNVKLYDRQIVHIAAAKLGINDLSEQDLLDLENTVHPLTLTFMPFHSSGLRLCLGHCFQDEHCSHCLGAGCR